MSGKLREFKETTDKEVSVCSHRKTPKRRQKI